MTGGDSTGLIYSKYIIYPSHPKILNMTKKRKAEYAMSTVPLIPKVSKRGYDQATIRPKRVIYTMPTVRSGQKLPVMPSFKRGRILRIN